MRKSHTVLIVSIAWLLAGFYPATTQAGKSGASSASRSSSGSSGRSYSSGRPSSGRSSSTSSRSSPSSTRSSSSSRPPSSPSAGSRSSAGSTSGRSYSTSTSSSGTSSKMPTRSSHDSTPASSPRRVESRDTSASSPRPVTPSSRPPAPSPSSSSTSRPPSRTPYDAAAGSAQQKAESKSAFGSRTEPAVPRSNLNQPVNVSPSPAGRSYSSGGAPNDVLPRGRAYSSTATSATSSSGKSPIGKSYDSAAASAQQQVESRATFTKGQAPRTTFTDPTGNTGTIDPQDQTIQQLRGHLDHERWVNRSSRQQRFYSGYSGRPVVGYRDRYDSFFWWWLLDQSLDRRATWTYHHRYSMDQTRYQDLLARDSQLETRVRELEAGGAPRDPTYAPEGIDSDLMYSDDYVDAAYNPQPVAPIVSVPPVRSGHSRVGVVILEVLAAAGILALLVWLVFIKRWGAFP